MPSLEESRRKVKEGLKTKEEQEPDHDAILSSLQDEIDAHNAIKGALRDSMRKGKLFRGDHRSPDDNLRFRFKANKGDSKERERRGRHLRRKSTHGGEDGERRHRRKKRRQEEGEDYPTPPQEDQFPKEQLEDEEEEAAHPFPREPANPDEMDTDAFRASLFDALADDEGAAYWESVYSQPIHVYSRPTVENEKGELEQMSEAEYVEYVKQKMWEKKHPEIVYQRKKAERERKEEEERKTRGREEFVRRKEQRAWERSQRRRFSTQSDEEAEENYEYVFDSKDWNANHPPGTPKQQKQLDEYAAAWSTYLAAWDKLKHEFLSELQDPSHKTSMSPSKRIPWPVLPSKPPIKAHIEAFMRHAPCGVQGKKERLPVLKVERVRWHPDKVQQRFGGTVDGGTMKLVTGVFQVVDGLVEEERKKVEG